MFLCNRIVLIWWHCNAIKRTFLCLISLRLKYNQMNEKHFGGKQIFQGKKFLSSRTIPKLQKLCVNQKIYRCTFLTPVSHHYLESFVTYLFYGRSLTTILYFRLRHDFFMLYCRILHSLMLQKRINLEKLFMFTKSMMCFR